MSISRATRVELSVDVCVYVQEFVRLMNGIWENSYAASYDFLDFFRVFRVFIRSRLYVRNTKHETFRTHLSLRTHTHTYLKMSFNLLFEQEFD